MFYLIDWLSFTVQRNADGEGHLAYSLPFLSQQASRLLGTFGTIQSDWQQWELAAGRAPYTGSIVSTVTGARMFYSPKVDHFLFELSGRTCELLRNADLETEILSMYHDRMTRVDVAFDMFTSARPDEFCATFTNARFRSTAVMMSDTGQTVYLGSPLSNRHLRCYRYNPPHPRSQFLRVEVVLRKQDAKAFAMLVLETTLEQAAQSLAAVFPFTHEAWKDSANDAVALTAWRPDRRVPGTLLWLYKQVTPAVQKLVNGGNIEEVRDWLQDLLQSLDQD